MDFIERETVCEKLNDIGGCGADPDSWADGWDKAISEAIKIVEGIPAADVEPVKHAKWAYGKLHGQSGYYCSECGTGFADINPNAELIAKSHDYCPHCGAKMDGVRRMTEKSGMTAQEAIKLIKECGLNIEQPLHDRVVDCIIIALEKQISKKIEKPYSEDTICGDEKAKFGTCCNCGAEVQKEMTFCFDCGQALDWSDEE